MARLKLSPPWVTYYRELNELFRYDPEINVLYDEENNVIKLYVESPTKAAALGKLLPEEKQFGSVTLTIDIVPANKMVGARAADYIDAFKGNPIVNDVVKVKFPSFGEFTYILFENKVVQYYNDNLADLNGFASTIYEDIARRVFDDIDGIFFCTNYRLDKHLQEYTPARTPARIY